MSASYVVRMPATAITAAKTLIQITAGAAPITILDVKVDQITKTTHEHLNIQLLRKTGAATVTSATPTKLQTLDGASDVASGTTATGYNASAEGSDGDVLEDLVWNVAAGSWGLLSIDDQIVVPPNGVVALKLMTAPAASMTVRAQIKYRELPTEYSFAPTDIAGLQLWLKADSLSLTDGDPVTTWTDSSGNGRDATQASSSKKPTYKTGIAGFNSQPVLQFDGSDDTIGTAAWSIGIYSIFAVFKLSGTAGMVYQFGTGAGEPYHYGTVPSMEVFRSGVGSTKDYATNWSVDGVAKISDQVFGGTHASHQLYIDGTLVSTTTNTNGSDPGTGTVSTTFAVASRGDTPVLPATGYIAEIVIYNTVLSTGDRESIFDYLGAKYGITVA